jgi:hypothetical protein
MGHVRGISERSLNGLEVRKHDAFHPQKRGILQDLGNRTDTATQAKPKGFDGDIDSNPITEFETIHDCPGRTIDANRDPIDIVCFDPGLMNFPRKSEYPQRGEIQPWSFCSPGKGNINPMCNLTCYSVKRQRGNETNNRGRDSGGYYGKVGISQVGKVCQTIKAAAQRNDAAFCAQ